MRRPTKVTAPNGQQTITEYGAGTDASSRYVKVKSQINATDWKQGYTWYDGIGRTVFTQKVDTNGDVFVYTEYDSAGRISKVSNPYRNISNPSCLTNLECTTNTYDSASRPWKVTTPDNAFVETTYGVVTSGSAIGTSVTVKDQALKERRSVTNALGQLIRVDEPTTSGLGSVSSPNQYTTYGYDLLNNLTNVYQGFQTRTFSYDAASRLKTAVNPESGTISYSYDSNGNLTGKTDARSITTTFGYDTLNRIQTRSYNDGTTPTATYYYDNVTNAKGKLIKVTNANSTTEYTSFDILGRVTGHKQTTDGTAYTTGYTYDLAGDLLEETYPSTRVVRNVLDSDGNLSEVESKKTSAAGYWPYANSFTYTAAGAVSSMQLGNGGWESTLFNSRLQPIQIALGTLPNGTDKLKLNFSYGTTANNGNVLSQTITVPGMTYPFIQNYSYDELNRLDDASETYNGTQTWRQDFTYDRFGNRNLNETNTTTIPKNCSGTICSSDRNIYNPGINADNKNRLNTANGYSFDNAGNLTGDSQSRTFTYDAENKQTAVNSGATGQYWYDADGKRIKKYVPGTGETTVFVYDAAGKMAVEYSTNVMPAQDAKVGYLTADHLGSPRINTDANGAITSRHDYRPFGEEVLTGQRTVDLNYLGDQIRNQFTGYERDRETTLDFAQARYFEQGFGRFMSPDPLQASAIVINPQSWNRYIYSLNNPLNVTDGDGLSPKPQFASYDSLTADEQRILENSKVNVGKGKNGQVLSGKALYDYMADAANKMQKNLANFLNQTAVLGSVKFQDGRTAISYVKSVDEIKADRITANVDGDLYKQIKNVSNSDAAKGTAYVGPENSSQEHGIYDTSFRENRAYTSQQISLASSLQFAQGDIDIDEECPYCGSKAAAVKHVGRAIEHKMARVIPFLERRTDAYGMYERLTSQRSIRPSYTMTKD